MFSDAEYRRTVVPNADVFSKSKESKLMIKYKYDKNFIADGKVLWLILKIGSFKYVLLNMMADWDF